MKYDGVVRELVRIRQAADEQRANDVALLGEMFQGEVLEMLRSEGYACTGERSDTCDYCESHCFDDEPVGEYFPNAVHRQGLMIGRN